MDLVDISLPRLALGFGLAIIPLALLLWHRIPMIGETLLALVRMAAQLLFVGFYLTVVFRLDSAWLTLLWLLAMLIVADLSVLKGCGLRLARIGPILLLALLAGTLLPMLYFTALVLDRPNVLEAQYAIPIGGMVLGNCLRADIVGLSRFFDSLRSHEKPFLQSLAQGAALTEALRPYLRDALQAALSPTVATMATIGLVSLPGMMTGVILAGADPIQAIKYQMVIMLSILSGTAITLWLALLLARRSAFTKYGLLDRRILKHKD